jgi:hypothetical protein
MADEHLMHHEEHSSHGPGVIPNPDDHCMFDKRYRLEKPAYSCAMT